MDVIDLGRNMFDFTDVKLVKYSFDSGNWKRERKHRTKNSYQAESELRSVPELDN